MFSFRLVSVVVVFKAYLYVRVDPCVYMYVFVVTWVFFCLRSRADPVGIHRYSEVLIRRMTPLTFNTASFVFLPAPVLSGQRQR